MPRQDAPSLASCCTTARITAFKPGQSPPPVSKPTFMESIPLLEDESGCLERSRRCRRRTMMSAGQRCSARPLFRAYHASSLLARATAGRRRRTEGVSGPQNAADYATRRPARLRCAGRQSGRARISMARGPARPRSYRLAPAMKSGLRKILRCSGMVVLTPSITSSSSARRMVARASGRVGACTISLPRSES